jgi:hypothetical protein
MGFFGGLGKALAAPAKLAHKATMGVGKGVNRAVQKTGKMVHKGMMAPARAMRGGRR